MSKEDEENVYHACINFCQAFFYLLCEKEKVRTNPRHEIEAYNPIPFEEDRFKHSFEELCYAVDEVRRIKYNNFVEDVVKSAIKNERTDLGRSVLIQLAENLGIEL